MLDGRGFGDALVAYLLLWQAKPPGPTCSTCFTEMFLGFLIVIIIAFLSAGRFVLRFFRLGLGVGLRGGHDQDWLGGSGWS